jgi:hypothetical protein
MEEHLLEEWRKFSLTEDEAPGFFVDDDAMGNSKSLGSNCLLGRLITDKYFNKAALKSSMLRLWGVTRGITIKQIGENLFVFQFPNEHERSRVMNGSPWLFENHLLALTEFDGSCLATQIQFNRCCFWVQLHGVPLYFMTKTTGERVGGTLGTVMEVDVPENGVGWGPFLRARISMDISKPIPRGRLITFLSLGQMWVSFKYERLPWLCFHCGVIGHLERDCVIRCRGGQKVGEAVQQYGPWLRAAELNQRRRDQGYGRDRKEALGRRGANSMGNLNFNFNRQEDFSESTIRGASSVPAQNEESPIPAGPQKSQQMDMHVDRVETEVSQHDVNDKAHAQHETVIAKEKESSKVVLPKDKGVAFSGLSHIPENRQNYEKVAGVLNAPSVTTNISTKSLPHVAQVVSPAEHISPSVLPHVIFSAKEGPQVGKKKGKVYWKRLAREKGKPSESSVVCSKRGGGGGGAHV